MEEPEQIGKLGPRAGNSPILELTKWRSQVFVRLPPGN